MASTKHINLITYPLLVTLLFVSCQKENTLLVTATKTYPEVQTELWIYFQRFEKAASDRGITIDLTSHHIHGKIEPLQTSAMIGICHYDPNAPTRIIIDEAFWTRASSLRREMIVFHELGHCYLELEHQDEAHNDGRCKSIMRSGSGDCLDKYTFSTREEYLDELFQQ